MRMNRGVYLWIGWIGMDMIGMLIVWLWVLLVNDIDHSKLRYI